MSDFELVHFKPSDEADCLPAIGGYVDDDTKLSDLIVFGPMGGVQNLGAVPHRSQSPDHQAVTWHAQDEHDEAADDPSSDPVADDQAASEIAPYSGVTTSPPPARARH